MSTQATQSSIVWNGDKPIWNYTEITAYPLEIHGNLVYAYMSPYTAAELRDVLKRAVAGYKRDKRDVEIIREDRSIYIPLCDKHFVRLGNANGTADEQRAFLDRFPELKPGIVEFSFGGVQPDMDQKSNDGVLDITMDLSGCVRILQDIYDPTHDVDADGGFIGKIVRVCMEHFHTHPTEAQYRQYRNARRSKFLRKQTLWTVAESHDTLESLYDAVIISVDGGAVNGKPCDKTTKQEWISGVPLWHKLYIVDQIFGELVEKNG